MAKGGDDPPLDCFASSASRLSDDWCFAGHFERVSLFLSQRLPEQAWAGLFRRVRSFYFFGAAGCFFACACARSLRRVSASCALNG
jgi:hypothetical protein